MNSARQNAITIHGTYWSAPDTVSLCPICVNDAGSVNTCSSCGVTICKGCFDEGALERLKHCPQGCDQASLLDRTAAESSIALGKKMLNSTRFNCVSQGCTWSGGYDELDDHRQSCGSKKKCDFGCGEEHPSETMAEHRQVCVYRPCQEGNLKTNYKTLEEIKAVKRKIEQSSEEELQSKALKIELFDRMMRVYPLAVEAALKDPEPSHLPQMTVTVLNQPCGYECGYIATSCEELSTHYQRCPNKTLYCRHCGEAVQQKKLAGHETSCDQRPINCTFCTVSILQGTMSDHIKTCISYPVNCSLCLNDIARSQLAEHKADECSSRPITCDKCLEPTTPGELSVHKQGCRFTQPICLSAKTRNPITLLPQPDSIGPFYLQRDSDDSTIYMAFPLEKLFNVSNCNTIFPEKMKCRYAGKPAEMSEYSSDYREVWQLHLNQKCTSRYESNEVIETYFDLLDENQNELAYFKMHYHGNKKVYVNYPSNEGKADLDFATVRVLLQNQSPESAIGLIRIRKAS
ncbi:hypothetical protein M3P05_10160 [Sansalvadorimonas sp. 2012CJ34-2]|uniref:TRAF-type domain-containing protein n=1 Tax=Parendozoicomonas callyspongiae TaxID=2942213 RepID=A0ABT0PFZ2_9GAMM|nr:hypothetical protein [Sansalvadorimonas sp. 2012CJ34-2]MCL6270284.1 hypothetical protein [Sansalvadorimonas sp. 2012CJ34-2]